MHILMVAAENGALPAAKVGGIGDVIRDAPRALVRAGHKVTVLTPGYQALSQLPGSQLLLTMTVRFANALETLALYQVKPDSDAAGVRHLVLEHPLFAACGIGAIYCHDAYEPFATDAAKFALFSTAVCHAVATRAVGKIDVVHLHDWHAALVLLLRKFDPAYQALQEVRVVYTIHNLSLQGVRPFDDNWSSPSHWFPQLEYERTQVADPRYPDCINLMRTGINLADQVHVVSPRYAEEILLPSVPASGLVRGEGLENDLRQLHKQGRLHGILNGCEYDSDGKTRRPTRKQMLEQAQRALLDWVGLRSQIPAAWFHAEQRLQNWMQVTEPGKFVLASVGRLTPQKVRLLQQRLDSDHFVLDALLELLDDGCLVMTGSGDPACEQFMLEAMRRHPNFLFLCGYDEKLGAMLYNFCDAFLMPSSYEPCGISQMLALRAGKPVLVHAVGGLADTVQHGVNGFSFTGKDEQEQAGNLVATFTEMLQVYHGRLPFWRKLCRNAANARFSWDQTVAGYLQQLYGVNSR
jgi:starch synthase